MLVIMQAHRHIVINYYNFPQNVITGYLTWGVVHLFGNLQSYCQI